MISLNRTHIPAVAQIHLDVCRPFVRARLKFVIDVYRLITERKILNISSGLTAFYGLDHKTLKDLIDPLLKQDFKKDGNTLKVKNDHIKSLLTQGNREILNEPNNSINKRARLAFFKAVQANIDVIIAGDVCSLFEKIINHNDFRLHDEKEVKAILKAIFKYKVITSKDGIGLTSSGVKWDNYEITKQIGINVCPYCNRNWINTVVDSESSKITNPQLDHFFSQKDYPLLGLSFYNLVPSCETCNARVKKEQKFEYGIHLSPYERGFGDQSKFTSIALDTKSAVGKGENYSINLRREPLTDYNDHLMNLKNFEVFRLKDIYQSHGDLISDLYFIETKFGRGYLKNRINMKIHLGLSIDEMYKVLFSNYYYEKDFHKRPFAKLTKDLVEDLKLL